MNIALVRVPSALGVIRKITHNVHPINIAYIAAYLFSKGHRVVIWDFEVEEYSPQLLRSKIEDFKPDIIGFSCMTPGINSGHMMAEEVKRFSPDIVTIVGGIHATALPERTLAEFTAFDIVVYGEGEMTSHEICEHVDNGKNFKDIKGIVFREKGRITKNSPRELIKDIDALPHPARNLLHLERYRGAISPGLSNKFLNSTAIFTSRGCPFSCTFCAAHLSQGKMLRERSLDNIESEIAECRYKYDINHIYFFDSTFTLNADRTRDIGKILKKYNMTYNCDSRVDVVSPSLLKDMKESGCVKISFGVEAGSERILQLIKKNLTRKQILDAFQWTHEAGIETSALFILGSHPSETMEDIECSYELAIKTKTKYPVYSIITPYPGTQVYSLMKEKNLIHSEDWSNFATHNQKPSWRTEHFSSYELVQLQKSLIRRHYVNPLYILRRLREIRSLREFRYWVEAGIGIIKYILRK